MRRFEGFVVVYPLTITGSDINYVVGPTKLYGFYEKVINSYSILQLTKELFDALIALQKHFWY